MKTRIITSIFILIVIVPMLIFSSTPALPIILALCSMFAVYEIFACVGYKKSELLSSPFYIVALAFPFFVRYCKDLFLILKVTVGLSILLVLYCFAVAIFSHGKYTVANVYTHRSTIVEQEN